MWSLITGIFKPNGYVCILYIPLFYRSLDNYIDPGTGSLVLQVVIAGFFGAIFMIKVVRHKIKALAIRLLSIFKK